MKFKPGDIVQRTEGGHGTSYEGSIHVVKDYLEQSKALVLVNDTPSFTHTASRFIKIQTQLTEVEAEIFGLKFEELYTDEES